MSVSDQLIQENFKGLADFFHVSFFFVERTLPPLVAFFGVPSHGFKLFEVKFVSDLGK